MPGSGLQRRGGGALCREAAAAFGVLIVLLNVLAGGFSNAHFEVSRRLAFSTDGNIVLCSGGQMLILGPDGRILPGEPSGSHHSEHDCICCIMMQTGGALPPPPAPAPARLAAIQIMRPGAAELLEAASVPTYRNRGPPLQA